MLFTALRQSIGNPFPHASAIVAAAPPICLFGVWRSCLLASCTIVDFGPVAQLRWHVTLTRPLFWCNMAYEPITSDATLQARVVLGVTVENEFLEFKNEGACRVRAQGAPDAAAETARDIAQMANARGGTVLIGVDEVQAPGGGADYLVASAFSGVQDVERIRQWLNGPVRAWLSPQLYPFTELPLRAGGVTVVAVNIPPIEHGQVAVWHTGQRNRIEFPVRTSFGKAYLSPDQLVERLMDRERAMDIRLRRLRDATEDALIFSPVRQRGPMDGIRKKSLLKQVQDAYGSIPQEYRGELHTWHTRTYEQCKLLEIVDGVARLRLARGDIAVPIGMIVEAWLTEGRRIGLILRFPIVIPDGTTEFLWLDAAGHTDDQ